MAAPSATPQCPQPIAARSSEGGTATTESQTSTASTLDGLLVDPKATAGELATALTTLARNSGPLGHQAEQLAAAVNAESPAPAGSIEALARARWQHLDVDGTLNSLNTSAADVCGEIFSSEARAAFSKERPAPASEGAVMLPNHEGDETSSWPTAGCKTSGELGYAPPEIAVYSCDRGAVTVDLSSGSTHVLRNLLPASKTEGGESLSLAGDHLAWVTVALTPASGLAKASWTSTLHIVDVTGAKVAERVLQAKHHAVTTSGEPTGVSSVQEGSSEGWLLLSYVSSADPETFSLANAAGEVLGSAKFHNRGDEPEPVGVIEVGDEPTEYMDEKTGKTHPYGGSNRYGATEVVNDGGCGREMLAGSEPLFFDENPPPDTVQRFARGTSGVMAEKVSVKTMFEGVDLQPSNVAALTPKGVLLKGPEEGHWAFYNFAGTKLWSLGAPVVSVTNAADHIVALNTSGEQIVINPATGLKEIPPAEVEEAIDSLAPTSKEEQQPDKIVLADPASDTLLIETPESESGRTVRKVSYNAVCG